MIDGILLINKQKDITSYDCIRKLKRILPKGQKIGHAGTLDPFATGLLIILLGKYTKKMVDILKMEKEYIVDAEFGYATDTQDSTGSILKKVENIKELEKGYIEDIIQEKYIGNIEQVPPQYSAKKVNGKKAYEFARKDEYVELEKKSVHIKSFEILEFEWPKVKFAIKCSSGTYVRTLINDLGESVGQYATAVALERTRIGKYSVKDSFNSSDISEDTDIKLLNILRDE